MTVRIVFPVLFAVFAVPALAERIEGQARTEHVTVFPQGAAIRWQVDLEAAAGTHELILPDLPQGLDPASLRVEAEGARIGSVSLQTARALPGEAPESAAVTEARTRLGDARDALIRFDADVAARRASAEAWRERAGITRDLMRGDSRVDADDLQAMVDEAGGMVADYLARAAAETRDADLMANRRDDVLRGVEQAEQHLAAVIDEAEAHDTLLVALEVAQSPARLTLTGFTGAAGWQPAYDLRLDRASNRLLLERGVIVQQSSGGDWRDVTLTLSTARPSDQSAPTEVMPWFPRIGDPDQIARPRLQSSMGRAADDMAEAAMFDAELAAPVVVETAIVDTGGPAVVYDYPAPVTIRNNADALRLKLDEKTLSPRVFAEATPRFDQTAFLMVEGTNTLNEPILPGTATLHVDGTMIGQTYLDLIVPGDDLRLGFGALDGLTAELRIPEASEGDRGIIRRSNQQTRTETLILRNLTGEDWPLRIVDRIPVATQEDLTVTWRAAPEPSETDPDGRRGLLYWQQDLAAGETREIILTTELRWPEGMVLLP
ncbi:DUF4139 domain-containing protein [Paracoccus marinaquae]|uniref:DUF4139 domain-containing protein n=1 Tax=Paracoccus marinaquae TaxID=2841926 RepID=A0ABS6AKJ0_9RHOB|nr:DUF4139 domain-containing protein [Paracoccus marinaquae]MBU3031096.1 DUF4139 domain-containing protein [Paracoccus marinaquae]